MMRQNMMQRTQLLSHSVLCVLLCLFSLSSQAELPTDKAAKLFIVSDTAQLNKNSGISIFTGNVKVDKGSTHITADKLTVYSDQSSRITRADAEGLNGHLATYQTMNDINKPPLDAKAQIIQYFPQQQYVILIGEANVVQGKDSLSGPHLEYDMQKQILITKAGVGQNSGRTQIVIQPNDMKQ